MTQYGEVRIKTGEGYGVQKAKPDLGDAARLAKDAGVPVADVLDAAMLAWEEKR